MNETVLSTVVRAAEVEAAGAGRGGRVGLGLALGLVGLAISGCGPGAATLSPLPGHPSSTAGGDPPGVAAEAPAAEVAEPAVATSDVVVADDSAGAVLYRNYCAACHGETGKGDGPAAHFLYPRPRNFHEAQFRLVTTTNQIPSDADLMRVLEHGMPGSAMFSFGHLPEDQREALVAYVRTLVRKGLEEEMRRQAAEFDEEVDPDELAEFLASRSEPGPVLEMIAELPEGPESLARGAALYAKNCSACHGETGKGDGAQAQVDLSGMPVRPRDLTRGIFKGGREPEQVHARIMLGAPGSPMPSFSYLKPEEVGDLIQFILSLSDPSASPEAEQRRTRIVAQRSPTPLPDEITEATWGAIEPTHLVVTPLWWRDFEPPGLLVQSVHDGETLAVRLSWHDASPDVLTIRTEDFPDKAAIQLFQGETEPFLGMGTRGVAGDVDVWFWDASASEDLKQYADVDTVHPDMVVDGYPFEELGEGGTHPTTGQPREFLSAWAVGNPRSDPTRPAAGSSLEAQGFGTLTMRPPISQSVTSSASYEDGRWTVVLRRPLKVEAGGGVALEPGGHASIGFALWDGAARDRDGQKLISIWHDLDLAAEAASTASRTNGGQR